MRIPLKKMKEGHTMQPSQSWVDPAREGNQSASSTGMLANYSKLPGSGHALGPIKGGMNQENVHTEEHCSAIQPR